MSSIEKKEARHDRKIFSDMVRRHKNALTGGPGDEDDDDEDDEEGDGDEGEE